MNELSNFVEGKKKDIVKYLTDKIMEGEKIKKLSNEVAIQKRREQIDHLQPGRLEASVSELSGTEFRGTIEELSRRMFESAIKMTA